MQSTDKSGGKTASNLIAAYSGGKNRREPVA